MRRVLGERIDYLLAAVFMALSVGFWDWCLWTGQVRPRVPELYTVYSLMWCLMLPTAVFLWLGFRSRRIEGGRLHDPVSKEHQDYDHGDVSDEWLWYDLRMTAREVGRPLGDIIGIIAMPDGRTATEWVRERPRVLKAFLAHCIIERRHCNDETAQVLPGTTRGDSSGAGGQQAQGQQPAA
jgi:hypothetical protein